MDYKFVKVLRIGDDCMEVAELQVKLIELGFGRCYLKDGSIGEISPEGIFGEVTQACLESFQAKVMDCVSTDFVFSKTGLKISELVTGELNAPTGYVLEHFEELAAFYGAQVTAPEVEEPEEELPAPIKLVTPVQKCIEIEKSQIGVHEIRATNTGPDVNEYQRIGSNGEVTHGGNPWCAYFQQWAWIETCKELDLEYKDDYSGYTPYLINWGKQNHICKGGKSGGGHVAISDIEIGDWGFIYSGSRDSACHIFMITSIDKTKQTVTTIEGNSNNGGSSDGGSVCKHVRPLSQIWAVVKWHKLY